MADPQGSIFNQKATERLRSPDDLDKYVQVTNPSVWLVLIACAALLVGILAWGIFGTVSTNVSTIGARSGDKVICLLDAEQAAKVAAGDTATVNGVEMIVSEISPVPLSRAEAADLLDNDYLASTLATSDWSYMVSFTGADANTFAEGVPLSISIVVESVAPISLIFGV